MSLPADTAKIVLSESDQNIIFAWKSDIKNADYQLRLSSSPDFTSDDLRINTALTTYGKSFNIKTLPEGTYYWKIFRQSDDDIADHDENAESEVRSFTVAAYVPGVNKLSWPPDGYSIEQDQLSRLKFSWKLASEYKTEGGEDGEAVLQISKTQGFNNLIIEEKTSASEFSVANIPNGTCYWRVGVMKNGEATAFTEPNRLMVVNPMPAPEITLPKADSKMIATVTEQIVFEWNKINSADYYKFVLYDETGNAIKSERVSDTRIKIELGQTDTKVSEKPESATEAYRKYSFTLQAVAKESDYSSARYGAEGSSAFEVSYQL